MQIEVAASAGFCPGVKRAVDMAYRAIEAGESPGLWLYGAVVHNELVIEDLEGRGARIAERVEDIPSKARVLIRAHGVSPDVLEALKEKDCVLLNGTCPFVIKIQKLAAEAAREGKGIIMTGRADHPEVIGVIGHAAPVVPVIIETAEEAEGMDFDGREWILVSQTTFSHERWIQIRELLKKKIANLCIFDTICSTTARRQSDARALAASSDVMLVLGSETSSNTNKLLEVCREECSDVHLIHRPDQVAKILEPYATGSTRVGVTTGASTPDGMIREVIYRMTTIEGMAKPEENADVNFEDYVDSIPELQPKSIVRGRIVRYDDEFVYVDVKDKSEGKVPIRELETNPDYDLDEAVKNHQEVDVYIRSIRSSDAGKEIMLSTGYVETLKHKEVIQKAFEERTPITVKVVNVVRDGVIASYRSIDVYIHRTQLELTVVDDLTPYRDQEFDVLITQFDPNRRRMRVSGSRRMLLQQERKASEREIWDTIEVGNEYTGVVRNLTNFGAFVDIGGVDGLIHISEMSWQRIRHPSEVLSVGDKVNVYVKDFDRSKKRISLGYRREQDDPYRDIEARFPVGAIVRGVVVRMFPFGAFINIAPEVDALCHISQISNYHLNKPGDVLVEGMEVDARVVEVSDEARRISVSIREVEPINPDPDSELAQQHEEMMQKRQQQAPRRRGGGGKRRGDQDDLPTSYVDDQARSAISSMADITAVTKEGSDLMDSMAALRDELQAAEKAGKSEEAETALAEPVSAAVVEVEEAVEEAAVEEAVVEEAVEEAVVEEAVEEAVVEEAVEEAVVEEAVEEAVVEEAVEEAVSEPEVLEEGE
ncbi:MAG TPA: bifunctional 4-hydroxy-3-methylbut-2-enyl diphosphate reductase/30S ribosomal protein S1 [Clostridiaceae bacterium]|nr:bifunctional 4-hydroxy-3-methylbut-2-enyl diphosphate reductase/30S ribosomal protein S1 [Clostridiaceae bacterium]